MSEPIFIEEWNGYKRGDVIRWRVQIANKKGTQIMEGYFKYITKYGSGKIRVKLSDGSAEWINQLSVVEQ